MCRGQTKDVLIKSSHLVFDHSDQVISHLDFVYQARRLSQAEKGRAESVHINDEAALCMALGMDGRGRVYGVDNVFVADGSIFPTSLGVNPMVTIIAAATKIADNISREHL